MLLRQINSGVVFVRDWSSSKISSCYVPFQKKHESLNSPEIDKILLDNLLQNCYIRCLQRNLKTGD